MEVLRTDLSSSEVNDILQTDGSYINYMEENISKGDEASWRTTYIFSKDCLEICRSPFMPDLLKKMEQEMGKRWMRDKGLYKTISVD